MIAAGVSRVPGRDREFEKLWIADCVVRERQGLILYGILALLVLPWSILDKLLEPTLFRSFLWLRLIDFALAAPLLLLLLRAHDIRRVRLAGATRILIAGGIIAVMCARVSSPHYFPYILGFSLVFWGIGMLHTWPVGYSVGLCVVLLGVYWTAQFCIGTERSVVDQVAALFYLGSTTFMCILCVENRRRLHYRSFLASYELGLRNRELDATVRSLRETQTRLVEGEKLSALGRLIASLSHEINNPVNVLRNNLEPLRDYLRQMNDVLAVARAGGDVESAWTKNELDFVLGDAGDALETMEQGISRIQTVHNEMRAFVRGDAPEMQAGDLNEGLQATANMFRRSLPRQIGIEVHCGVLPATMFQPGQMNQVFFNLLQNAVDSIEGSGQPGTIAIRSEPEDGWVRVTVEDTGPGVSPWAREHLFEPFFTTKGAGKGTGLGLATSYQIVHRHRGSIELAERPVGRVLRREAPRQRARRRLPPGDRRSFTPPFARRGRSPGWPLGMACSRIRSRPRNTTPRSRRSRAASPAGEQPRAA